MYNFYFRFYFNKLYIHYFINYNQIEVYKINKLNIVYH